MRMPRPKRSLIVDARCKSTHRSLAQINIPVEVRDSLKSLQDRFHTKSYGETVGFLLVRFWENDYRRMRPPID